MTVVTGTAGVEAQCGWRELRATTRWRAFCRSMRETGTDTITNDAQCEHTDALLLRVVVSAIYVSARIQG